MEIKKITPEHKEKVLQISKDIWEGDDYIPQIFDEWVADPYGEFVGLFDGETLIAFGKMTYLTPTDVWLEGLRKDQKSEVKGIARYFTEHYLKILSQRKDLTSVRFATYFQNYGSIIPAERCGFQRVLTCSLKNLEINSKGKIEISPNITHEISYKKFKDYILTSSYLKKCKNLLSKGWVLYDTTEQLLAEFYVKKQFGAVVENGIIKGLILFSDIYYTHTFWISFLSAASNFARHSLLLFAKKTAQDRNKSEIQFLVPEDKILSDWVEKNGFTSWERNNDFIVFDFPLEVLIK
jgi:hypothetical protein